MKELNRLFETLDGIEDVVDRQVDAYFDSGEPPSVIIPRIKILNLQLQTSTLLTGLAAAILIYIRVFTGTSILVALGLIFCIITELYTSTFYVLLGAEITLFLLTILGYILQHYVTKAFGKKLNQYGVKHHGGIDV